MCKQPFQPGQVVAFKSAACRVEPFLADDILTVDSLSRGGTSRKPTWRVRVVAVGRAASGWLDAGDLELATGVC